jgi:hypothetical protein
MWPAEVAYPSLGELHVMCSTTHTHRATSSSSSLMRSVAASSWASLFFRADLWHDSSAERVLT